MSTAEQFAKGVQLHNEKDLTKPAVLEVRRRKFA
jgi:16S rRNA pseudouridine516 synthase